MEANPHSVFEGIQSLQVLSEGSDAGPWVVEINGLRVTFDPNTVSVISLGMIEDPGEGVLVIARGAVGVHPIPHKIVFEEFEKKVGEHRFTDPSGGAVFKVGGNRRPRWIRESRDYGDLTDENTSLILELLAKRSVSDNPSL